MASVKSATVLVLSNTGSRYEEREQFGIAHFFEHIVFKGTQSYPTAHDLSSTIDGIGADFNAFTSKEYTGYYVKAAARHLDLSLDVVSDMLLTPKLRQDDIDREKGVIIEELNMYVDMPARHINNIYDQLFYDGSGLAHDIIGTKETISGTTSERFQAFLRKWYGLGNLVVIVAGDASVVDDPKLLKKIEQAFAKGDVSDRANGKQDLSKYLSDSPVSDKRFHLEHRATEQAHFVLGWPGITRTSPEKYAAALLGIILGGNMSSRLFSEVRETRGLCYYVHSDVDMNHDGGNIGASAGVEIGRVEEAIEVTKDVCVSLADGSKPVTKQELEKAKEYAIGKFILSLEDSESVAQTFGMRELLLGEEIDVEELIAKYRAVNLDEVQAVAKKLISSDGMRLALIGPYQDEGKFKRFC